MQRTTLRRSTQPGTMPDLLPGELGVNMANLADLHLYLGVSSGPPIDLLKQAVQAVQPALQSTVETTLQNLVQTTLTSTVNTAVNAAVTPAVQSAVNAISSAGDVIITRDLPNLAVTLWTRAANSNATDRVIGVLRIPYGGDGASLTTVPPLLGEIDLGNVHIHTVNNARPSLIIEGTSQYQGASIRMKGPGTTTPTKVLRVLNGVFGIFGDNYNELFRVEDNGNVTIPNGGLSMYSLKNAVNDAAAATAGVQQNQLYRNGSQLMVRVA